MICIPVVAARQDDALRIIEQGARLADVLELRMDMLQDGNLKELIGAVRSSSSSVKVLVTNRQAQGSGASDEKERIGVLLEAVSLGADFVDMELTTAPVWRERVKAMIARRGSRTALIVSHHEFTRTPSRKALIGVFNESVQAGAGIVKIVTLARAPQDNLAVLSLVPYARRRKREIIAFCMGKEGQVSRVMAPLLGAFFTFASLKRGAESAAGQLTIGDMRNIYRILERERGSGLAF